MNSSDFAVAVSKSERTSASSLLTRVGSYVNECWSLNFLNRLSIAKALGLNISKTLIWYYTIYGIRVLAVRSSGSFTPLVFFISGEHINGIPDIWGIISVGSGRC